MVRQDYLRTSAIIDWDNLQVLMRARSLRAEAGEDPTAIAQACFEWVRDHIRHSVDYQLNPVTCKASDVLHHRSGYCYAKSHLLAALLRANGIPSGFCYQRLSLDDQSAPYCLHGFNGAYLPEWGWYRMDARGNRQDSDAQVNAQFTPPTEQLAFPRNCATEADFPAILPHPLPVVLTALAGDHTWDALLKRLPDIEPAAAHSHGLDQRPPSQL